MATCPAMPTGATPYRVFISSTSEDLRAHREVLIAALHRFKGFEPVAFEHAVEEANVNTGDSLSWSVEQSEACDVFVGILGFCYGRVPEAGDRSFTEHEYSAALQKGKPMLMFFADDNFPVPARLITDDSARQRDFRQRASKHIRATFMGPEDLVSKVERALHNWEMARRLDPGIGQPGAPQALLGQPSFLHSYSLELDFVGRRRERQMLSDWMVDPTAPPVFLLGGLGGQGKSALTWVWVNHDVLGFPLSGTSAAPPEETGKPSAVPPAQRPDGVLWWSFYERQHFGGFLREAMRYVTKGQVEVSSAPSQDDAVELANQLARQRVLVALDGFERLVGTVRGSEANTFFDPRGCADPLARKFLERVSALATSTDGFASRILITARVLPREIEARTSCRFQELAGLAPEDAVVLLRHLGVQGTDEELRQEAERWLSHPLCLRLLAGALVGDPVFKGDIRHARELNLLESNRAALGEFNPNKLTRILQFAYDSLRRHDDPEDDTLRELMRVISADEMPLSLAEIAKLRGEDTKQLLQNLQTLQERGLLSYHAATERYDMHPSVRVFCRDQLLTRPSEAEEIWGHHAADRVLPRDVTFAEAIHKLVTEFEQAVASGRLDRALNLFESRLFAPLFFRQGDYLRCKRLLAQFLDGEEDRILLDRTRDRAWVLNALGIVMARQGEPVRARRLLEKALALYEGESDGRQAATVLCNLARIDISFGYLDIAKELLNRSLALCAGASGQQVQWHTRARLMAKWASEKVRSVLENALPAPVARNELSELVEQFDGPAGAPTSIQTSAMAAPHRMAEGAARIELGNVYSRLGDWAAAEREFNQAEKLVGQRPDGSCQISLQRAWLALRQNRPLLAWGDATRALLTWELETQRRAPHQVNRILIDWVLGVCHLELAEAEREDRVEHLANAERSISEAWNGCRETGFTELMPELQLGRSRWYFLRGEYAAARSDAEQAGRQAHEAGYAPCMNAAREFLAKITAHERDRRMISR